MQTQGPLSHQHFYYERIKTDTELLLIFSELTRHTRRILNQINKQKNKLISEEGMTLELFALYA